MRQFYIFLFIVYVYERNKLPELNKLASDQELSDKIHKTEISLLSYKVITYLCVVMLK